MIGERNRDMKLLVVSGVAHKVYKTYFPDRDIANHEEIVLNQLNEYVDAVNPVVDCVFLTDEAVSSDMRENKQNILSLLEWMDNIPKKQMKFLFITRDPMLAYEIGAFCEKHKGLLVLVCDSVRVSETFVTEAVNNIQFNRADRSDPVKKPEEPVNKPSFLSRFMQSKKQTQQYGSTDPLKRGFDQVSRSISKVIAITGHRGSGLTSTCVNMAYEACKRGLSPIIVDMDIDYRSMNMYFDSFSEKAKSLDDMNASLVRTLARPQDYMVTAYHVKDNFWLTSLGYGFTDQRLLEQFYTGNKLVGLLSVLKNKFNVILLDFPMDQFRKFGETLIHIDTFGLCIPNNLYAILSTLRSIELVFGRSHASYINAKSRVIVTKYNDRARFQNDILAPEKVAEILTSGINENFIVEMKVAGYIPYCNEFDQQIETDIPIVNSNVEYEKAYGRVLLRLLEGAD